MTGSTRGTFKINLGLFLAELICIPAFVFELDRALGGNTLSWAYVFEWPLLGGYADGTSAHIGVVNTDNTSIGVASYTP